MDCYTSPKLKVSRYGGQIDIEIIDTDKIVDTSNEKTYDIGKLVCLGSNGEMFPNIDEVNEVSNEWIFLD